MKQFKINGLFIALGFCLAIASCKKASNTPAAAPVTTGLYVLNQGLFGSNNSTLSFYSYTTKQATTDEFAAVNSRGLGDTGWPVVDAVVRDVAGTAHDGYLALDAWRNKGVVGC